MSVSKPVDAVLLDIEGTTTPIDFVTQTLFPYARVGLADYLTSEWPTPELQADVARLRAEHAAEERSSPDLPHWEAAEARLSAERYLLWLMDRDRKSTALKSIQGKVWRQGYETRRLIGQVYPDVPGFLKRWKERGGRAYLYSSGSVLAQRLLFQCSDQGDLTPLLDGYFDTSIGPKREASSYEAIAQAVGLAPHALLFVSDVVAELAAARAAGLQTALSIRPGNAPVDAAGYRVVTDFEALERALAHADPYGKIGR
jgi:enolase-phosphatase E1